MRSKGKFARWNVWMDLNETFIAPLRFILAISSSGSDMAEMHETFKYLHFINRPEGNVLKVSTTNKIRRMFNIIQLTWFNRAIKRVFTEYIISNIQIYSNPAPARLRSTFLHSTNVWLVLKNFLDYSCSAHLSNMGRSMESALTNQSASNWSLHLVHVTTSRTWTRPRFRRRKCESVGSSLDLITKP